MERERGKRKKKERNRTKKEIKEKWINRSRRIMTRENIIKKEATCRKRYDEQKYSNLLWS